MGTGIQPPMARIKLNARWSPEQTGHLWVYAGHIGQIIGQPAAGDLVDVLSPNGRFYGRGFFNPFSKIRVRILTFKDEPIHEGFWKNRIQQAVRLRQRVVMQSDAYRLIHGEGDRLPGLIVDRYGQTLVMQTLSYGIDCRKEQLAEMLMEKLSIGCIYIRNNAKSRRLEGLPLEHGFIRGKGPTQVEIREGTARFVVDIERGQKTGWFCDQRENRLAAAKLASGGEVLDVFCHTGAFGIHAALAGAVSIEGIDAGNDALTLAREQANRNHVDIRCSYRKSDAFEELRCLAKAGRRFDLVVLDPPAFARSQQAVPRALAGYRDINHLGFRLLKSEGYLVTSSCSQPISGNDLWMVIRLAARDARREIRLIEQRGQAADHPILASMPETRYLKSFIVQAF